ncbi:hypothetical protein Tco_0516348 [Tanacetum coccineum]
MVAYLQNSEESEGFHQIIDFLNASHIQYALTKNLTIYVSFIKQFWKTATARTSANGDVELTATIDGQVKTITEASLRRHLKLEDNGGVTTLPNSEIFEQLALMGYVTDSDKLTFQKEEATPMPHELPLQSVHSLGCDEGSVSLNELTNLCTSLSKKVGALENELQQTKKTYSTAITKLISRGRKIFEIDIDPSISLVQDEGPLWFQEDAEIQKKISNDTEVLLEEEEPTEISLSPEKRQRSELEQKEIGIEEAVRLQEQLNEEETQRIARDAEIAKQFQEEYDRARQEQEIIAKEEQAYVIDWSDPAVLRYHALQNRPYSVAKKSDLYLKEYGIRINLLYPWIRKTKKKSSKKKAGASRKKTLARKRAGEKQSDQSAKRQMTEYEKEKEELKAYLDLVPREEFAMDFESLATTSRPEGYDLML